MLSEVSSFFPVLYSSLTLISTVVEDIEGIHCLFTSLLITKDQVNPLMEVIGHVLRLLQFKIKEITFFSSFLNKIFSQENAWVSFRDTGCLCRLTRAFLCFLIKSSLDVAQRGSTTSVTGSWDICNWPRSKPITVMEQLWVNIFHL